jgi:SMC interacting uncharacterized protein involved in chromosome segregation
MAAATDQEQELTALREQRDALHRELVRKTFRIGELEHEQSLSWKLTRPVRGLKPTLKKLLR